MKKTILAIAALVLILFPGCENKRGAFISTVKCSHPVEENVKNFEKILEENGLSIFQVIDHAQNAKNAEMLLEPTTLVVFGNPKMGTALMKCNQSMGMDLPLRMLFYTDYEGNHWLSYTNPEYYSLKHNIKDKKCLAIINKINIALQTLAEEVADNNSSTTSADQNSSDQNDSGEKQ
jgi:uncharacterized protein (DUF302 family)